MSLNDPVELHHHKKWGWILIRGRETFYDEDDYLRSWATAEEARDWAIENLGIEPVEESK